MVPFRIPKISRGTLRKVYDCLAVKLYTKTKNNNDNNDNNNNNFLTIARTHFSGMSWKDTKDKEENVDKGKS